VGGSTGIGAGIQIIMVNHMKIPALSINEGGRFLNSFKKSLTLEFYSFIESYSIVEITRDLQ
jgi:hypothetical protein